MEEYAVDQALDLHEPAGAEECHRLRPDTYVQPPGLGLPSSRAVKVTSREARLFFVVFMLRS
jgi:hypothetical protein